jgi:hypothetical protein
MNCRASASVGSAGGRRGEDTQAASEREQVHTALLSATAHQAHLELGYVDGMRAPLLGLLLVTACQKAPVEDPAWRAELERFHAERTEAIASEDGWLTMVARAWLAEGPNAIGAAPESVAVLPADRSPPLLGTVTVEHGTLRFDAAPGATVTHEGQPVTSLALKDDSTGAPTVLEAGSLRMHVIQRGGRFALRAKDRNHPARARFTGLTWYPADPAFKVKATLEHTPDASVPIVNVLNQTESQPSPGVLTFELGGATQRLVALSEPGAPGLFVIFKDATAGEGTYPAGRFLNTPAVGPDDSVVLDFNEAYSPPCAFTSFATCPLPPKQNHLPVRITAGETYAGHHGP